MKMLLSGSGSGGHIYPCISLYETLKKDNKCDILIFKNIDKKIYDMNNINYHFIDNNLSNIKKFQQIYKFIKDNNYDCCLTFGGKNSTFIAIVCKMLKINLYCFEQNAVIGKANKVNYLFANKLFCSFPLNKNFKKEVVVGNPSAERIKPKQINIFKNNKPVVLIVMGSLGSSSVNKIIELYLKECGDLCNYIIVTGNNVKSNLKEKNNLKIFDYYNPLTDLIAYCDVIVSRAGATTIAEIIKFKKPSILIPSPYVANNHQEINANYILKNNACLVIKEKDLNIRSLKNSLNKLIVQKDLYNLLVNNLKKLDINDIHKKIISEIKNDKNL